MIRIVGGLFLAVFLFAQQGQAQIFADTVLLDSLNLTEKIIPRGDIRESHPITTANELVDSDFPGSWPMFGKAMRMKLGGYVKADFIYDFNGTRDRTQFLMATIPVEGEPDFGGSGYLSFFAKETRLNIDVRALEDTKFPLRLFVEGDFFSTPTQFRLRHAYVTVGDFIFGQNWTTLTFLETLPFIIDFAAGDALFGGRTVQIRYQKKLSEKFHLGLGIELLATQGIQNADSIPGIASAQLPLFAAKGEYRRDDGVIFLGGSIAQLRWDGGPGNPTPSALQYSIIFAGRQYVFKKHYFTWNLNYGSGMGENILAFIGSDANAVLSSPNQLDPMRAFSALVGIGIQLLPKWSTNFSYAYGWLIDIPETRDPFSLKRGGIGHVNVIWQPNHFFSTGLEYIWGAQRTANDALGSANRLQFMTKVDF